MTTNCKICDIEIDPDSLHSCSVAGTFPWQFIYFLPGLMLDDRPVLEVTEEHFEQEMNDDLADKGWRRTSEITRTDEPFGNQILVRKTFTVGDPAYHPIEGQRGTS